MDNKKRFLILLLFLSLAIFIFWYLSNYSEKGVLSVEHTEDQVLDQDGEVVVTVESIPNSVDLSEESTFGVSGAIVEVNLSPDKKWLAIARTGVAHSVVWLYNISSKDLYPADFQYGGGLDILGWSPDSRFLALGVSSPSGAESLSIVDNQDLKEKPNALIIDIEDVDPPFVYDFQHWDDARTICFQFLKEDHCLDVVDFFDLD